MNSEVMESNFYKTRSLLGRLSAAFKFINDNSAYLLKRGSYILLPLVLLQAIFFTFFRDPVPFSVASIVTSSVISIISIVVMVFFQSFVYAALQKYIELGYVPLSKLKDLKPLLLQNAKKIVYVGLFNFIVWVFLCLVAFGVAFISAYTLAITVPLIFFLLLALVYFTFEYVFGDDNMSAALKKSFRMGISYWGSTFAMFLVLLVLVGIIQLVASLPLYTAFYVEILARLSVLQGNETNLPGFFQVLLFVLALIAMFISMFSTILIMVPMAFQYGSIVASKKEKEIGISQSE